MLERLKLLISNENIDKIKNSKIIIIGIGGVGGSCLEGLVRTGFENITIVDNDIIDESNLNRQIITNSHNIGQYKCDIAEKRAKDINPNINITKKIQFIDETNITDLKLENYDYIIDTQDTTNTKILLIKESIRLNKKIISSMGTGNRIDPSKLTITNIWKTNNDPLAKKIRNLLRKERITAKIPVISSTELPIKTNSKTVGSTAFVPNSAGLLIASYIFQNTIKK